MFPLAKIPNTNINPVLGMTYNQFLDHRTSMVATSQAINSTANSSCYAVGAAVPKIVFFNYQELVDAPPYGNMMWGTSFGSWFTWDSAFGRLAQHCIPTEFYADHKNNNRVVMLKYTATTSKPNFISYTKNGYQSIAYSGQAGNTLDTFVYLDSTSGYMMEFNPSIPSAPKLYIPE